MRIWIAFICLFFCLFAYAQQKHVFVVAVSEYPSQSGWSKIHSNNDAAILVPEFQRLGFHCTVLLNEQATQKNILHRLDSLEESLVKGDYVVLHFSCHGQQMEDDNGDEVDKLDEALIPYDAAHIYNKGIYEGESHLRDDELERHLMRIRKQLGETGSLFVTLDACHSGTANRIEEYQEDEEVPVRGSSSVFSSDPFFLSPEIKKVERNTELPHLKGYSPVCVISACQPFQRNFETKVDGQYYGTLSYSLYQVLTNCDKWIPSLYPMVLDNAKRLSIKQIPMMERTY